MEKAKKLVSKDAVTKGIKKAKDSARKVGVAAGKITPKDISKVSGGVAVGSILGGYSAKRKADRLASDKNN